jgi:hypothetical protein
MLDRCVFMLTTSIDVRLRLAYIIITSLTDSCQSAIERRGELGPVVVLTHVRYIGQIIVSPSICGPTPNQSSDAYLSILDLKSFFYLLIGSQLQFRIAYSSIPSRIAGSALQSSSILKDLQYAQLPPYGKSQKKANWMHFSVFVSNCERCSTRTTTSNAKPQAETYIIFLCKADFSNFFP